MARSQVSFLFVSGLHFNLELGAFYLWALRFHSDWQPAIECVFRVHPQHETEPFIVIDINLSH